MTKIKEVKRLEEVGVVDKMAIWGFPDIYTPSLGRGEKETQEMKSMIRDKAPNWANAFYYLGTKEKTAGPDRLEILYLNIRD